MILLCRQKILFRSFSVVVHHYTAIAEYITHAYLAQEQSLLHKYSNFKFYFALTIISENSNFSDMNFLPTMSL